MSIVLSAVILLSITIGFNTRVNAAGNPYPQYNYYNSASDYQIACTWYAWKQANERLSLSLPSWGNAGSWYSAAGYSKGSEPKANSIACWSYTNSPSYGHVAYVTSVNSDGSINIVEGGSNWSGNNHGICSRTVKRGRYWPDLGFIYIGNNDTTGPSFDDFKVCEFTDGRFTVYAHITDPSGISSVKYAVWTPWNNGQDDLVWYTGNHTDGNGYHWIHVYFSEHNNEKGSYVIDMYATDNAGNVTSSRISYDFPDEGPSISNVKVSNVSSSGYTVTCTVKSTSEMGVSKVQFPTWTAKNGQDDIASEWWSDSKVKGTITGNTATFRVNSSEHNNETGNYMTHIYAYDKIGNATSVAIPLTNVHNHKWNSGKVTKAATCTAFGIKTYTCTVCGETKLEALKAKGHTTVTDKAIAATCTSAGKTEGSHCSVCNKVLVEPKEVATNGHKWDTGKVTKKATPTATGVKTYTCTVCGAKKTQTIAKCAKYVNTLTVSGKTATSKYKNLKKKNQTVSQKNAFTVNKAQGKVTYTKASGNKNITVSSAGKIIVKKGLKKGTYKIAVKITAAGNATYKAATKTVTVTIKVK